MKQVFLYLFVFSFVINLFQYISDTKILKEKEQEIETLHKKVERQADTIQILKEQQYEKLFNHRK